MSWLAAAGIGLGTSALGAYQGQKDVKKAKREQERYIGLSIEEQWNALRKINEGIGNARPYFDDALGVAQSLENDLLGQIDPITAGEVRRIRQERQAAQAQMSQQMAASGLDSFTTRQGAQSMVQGQASNAMSELAARVASQRTGAIQAGRGAEMNALSGLGNFELQAGQLKAQPFNAMSQIYGGVQVQPSNTAAAIGAFGNTAMEGYRTSVLEKALAGAGPGGGALPYAGRNG